MKKPDVKIVIGTLFGDEGKGVVTQWLCQQALAAGKKPIVVRYSGGPQAGHTVRLNGIEHICSSYGSGVLLGVPTYIASSAYFDPICAYKEAEVLQLQMGDDWMTPSLYVDPCARIITPFDVIAGQNNQKVISDGTCGKGIYQTYKRYLEVLWDGLEWSLPYYWDYWDMVDRYYRDKDPELYEVVSNDAMKEFYRMYSDAWHSRLFCDQSLYSTLAIGRYDTIIFEGSQGLLLDMDRGFFPHVTPSRVGLNGILQQYLDGADVYFVTRTYLTRHGNGYDPEPLGMAELERIKGVPESNVFNEWQGEFKLGKLSQELIDAAYQRHCIDSYIVRYNLKTNLVVTHADVLPENDALWMFRNWVNGKKYKCVSADGMITEIAK